MDPICADYAATTPLDKRVLEAMMPYLTDVFYNAASSHSAGMQAQHAVMKSRIDVANLRGNQLGNLGCITCGPGKGWQWADKGCYGHV